VDGVLFQMSQSLVKPTLEITDMIMEIMVELLIILTKLWQEKKCCTALAQLTGMELTL